MREYKNKLLVVGFIIASHYLLACSQNPAPLTQKNLQQDLKWLVSAVTEGHPVTLVNSDFSALQGLIDVLPDKDYTAWEYELQIRSVLARVGCTHTYVSDSPLSAVYKSAVAHAPYLPVKILADHKGFYLVGCADSFVNARLIFPLEVNAINGQPLQSLYEQLSDFHPVDGRQQPLGRKLFNEYSEILLRRFFLKDSVFQIDYVSQTGENMELILKAVKHFTPRNTSPQYQLPDPLIDAEDLHMVRLGEHATLLKLKSMSYKNSSDLHEEIFSYLENHGSETLVVDLRGNSGGEPRIAFDFLSYILSDTLSQRDIRPDSNVSDYLSSKSKLMGVWFWDKVTPKEYTAEGTVYITNTTTPKSRHFKGTIMVLIDGHTASAACTLAALLKHKAGAICIGQETAGGETGSNANSFQTLLLPRSQIKINFPIFRFRHNLDIPDVQGGIKPDIPIEYTVRDLMANRDLEMEYVRTQLSLK